MCFSALKQSLWSETDREREKERGIGRDRQTEREIGSFRCLLMDYIFIISYLNGPDIAEAINKVILHKKHRQNRTHI